MRVFSAVIYAHLVVERTAKIATKPVVKSTTKEIARELEKMLVEKASKKKIAESIEKLEQEYFFRNCLTHNRAGLAFFTL